MNWLQKNHKMTNSLRKIKFKLKSHNFECDFKRQALYDNRHKYSVLAYIYHICRNRVSQYFMIRFSASEGFIVRGRGYHARRNIAVCRIKAAQQQLRLKGCEIFTLRCITSYRCTNYTIYYDALTLSGPRFE